MVRTPALPLLLALTLFSCQSFSEEISANSLTEGKMSVRSYGVTPGFFTESDLQDKTGKRKPVAGVHPIPGNHDADLDVSEFLKQSGLSFPKGSMAVYDQNHSIVSIVNTPENLDLADRVMECGVLDVGIPYLVNCDLSAVEFTAPGFDQFLSKNIVPYSDFVKMAGKSPRVVGHVSVLGRFGQRSTVQQILNVAHEKKGGPATRPASAFTEAFHEGESGSKVELEPTIYADKKTIDCNLSCRFRFDYDGRDVLVDFVTSCTAWDGCPVVVHVSPIPGKGGKYLAIVLRLQVINASGWRRTEELQKLKGAQK
jgi:hypothetical protein